VVHLWVEGFFEVFATVVIAFLFTRMGLLRIVTATSAVLFSCTIFLSDVIFIMQDGWMAKYHSP
jgi:nitric oxide reductase subunit B